MPPHVLTAATMLLYPNKFRYSEILPVLPCFYNLPIKKIQKLLNSSHGTLAKARKAWGLDRWPYESITQGRFHMAGVHTTWEDIDRMQQETIERCDGRMARTLRIISQHSREYRCRIREKENNTAAARSTPLVEHYKSSPNFDTQEMEGEYPKTGLNSPAVPVDEPNEEDQTHQNISDQDLLCQVLQEDPVTEPCPKEMDLGSYWQGLYELLDPDRVQAEPASPSLLD
jgi:hypothetical protein